MKRTPVVGRLGGEPPQRGIFNKENESVAPPEKKRKLASKDTCMKVTSDVNGQIHEALSSWNAQQQEVQLQAVCQQTISFRLNDQGKWETGRMAADDVHALLSTKITGKSRFDYKGKNEQMLEHIRKLRACIQQFLQVETAYILQCEQLQSQLVEEKRTWESADSVMKKRQHELETDCSELRERCSILDDELASLRERVQELLLSRERDCSALQETQKECGRLLEEVGEAKRCHLTACEQVKSLEDINKRLTEYNASLQLYNSKLQSDATSAAEENGRTKKEKITILESLSSARGNAAALQAQLDTVNFTLQGESKQKNNLLRELEKLGEEVQQIREEKDRCNIQIEKLTEENASFKDFTGKSAAELEIVANKAIALEESYVCQSEKIKTLQHQLDVANQKLHTAEYTIEQQRKEEAGRARKLEELQSQLIDAEQRLNEGELVRRKLHNTIQELKGNIRVFCRVRPILPDDEDSASECPVVHYPNSAELLGHAIELAQTQGQKYTFSFDKVFGPEVTQGDVFEDISQLVQSAFDGYKVCIFAYGQTGSGKTYTMLGQPHHSEHKGLIPRSLEQIFKSSQVLQNQGWSFRMQASMLEIYNEAIRDLLVSPKINGIDGAWNDSGTAAKVHTIKHDALGNTHVSDLMLVDVTSWKEVSTLLQHAAQSRTVGKTAMNEQSSRSHCVFTLRISGVNKSTEQQIHGVLNLVDLAGSERLSRSGATGERLKETQAINKSLSSLGDVILSIANKEQHIPYRNSKLTYLLQPCLGGDSKTLMFVNISPDSKSFNESLCSLRFAAKVNACEIGVPRRQTFTRGTEARLSSS